MGLVKFKTPKISSKMSEKFISNIFSVSDSMRLYSFCEQPVSFQPIIEKYCVYSFSQRGKGAFERIMQAHLHTVSLY